MRYLLLLSIVLMSCGNSSDGSGGSGEAGRAKEILKKKFCPLVVAKFGECSNESSVKTRFNFNKLKKWIYEDCEKTRVQNPTRYLQLHNCIQKDCSGLNSCLEKILGSRSEKGS